MAIKRMDAADRRTAIVEMATPLFARRGFAGTTTKEIAEAAGVCVRLHEPSIPVREAVRGVSEILGLDPLYYANEGKLIAVLPSAHAEAALAAMRAHPSGRDAALIGEVTAQPPGSVILKTTFGGERIVDMLVGEQLPRIC